MRKLSFSVAILLLVIIAWFGWQGNPPRAEDAKPAIQRLQYRYLRWQELDPPEEKLNDLGDRGWDMCGIIPAGGTGSNPGVVFKRRTP